MEPLCTIDGSVKGSTTIRNSTEVPQEIRTITTIKIHWSVPLPSPSQTAEIRTSKSDFLSHVRGSTVQNTRMCKQPKSSHCMAGWRKCRVAVEQSDRPFHKKGNSAIGDMHMHTQTQKHMHKERHASRTHMHMWTHTGIHMGPCRHTYSCGQVCTHTYTHLGMCTHRHPCTHRYPYIHKAYICAHMCIYAHTWVCIYIDMHTERHACIYAHMYM